MKVFVSYLAPLEQEFEIPDKFRALTKTQSQTEYEKLEEKFSQYIEQKIRPTLEAKTLYGIDFCSIEDEDGNMLAEY